MRYTAGGAQRLDDLIHYRGVLNTPGIVRTHELQRLVSYGIGSSLPFIVSFPGWRGPTVLGLCLTMWLWTVFRLVTGRQVNTFILAHIDLFAAGLAIAVGTASGPITIVATLAIDAAIIATFKASTSILASAALAAGMPGILVAVALDLTTGSGTGLQAALILIAIALALSSFIIGVIAVEARELRRRLGRRETQLSAVLEVTPVVLAAVDDDMRVTTLAGHFDAWDEFGTGIIEPDSPLAVIVSLARSQGLASGDLPMADRTFNVTCDASTSDEVLLTVYDVTERIEVQRRLEEVVRSKDQFIAAVSHELRTPLSSVVGFSELLDDEMESDNPLQPMVKEVVEQSAEMAAIIDDLLIAARASFESVPTQPRDIDLHTEAANVVETMEARLSKSPTCFLGEVSAHADPIRVHQIIRNLLTNADRYGGKVIKVTTTEAADAAILRVEDSGPPLPSGRRDAIFEPYESSGPVRGQPAAIGLGLAVSRTLAELMGGSLEYDHIDGWSVFELRLPLTNGVAAE